MPENETTTASSKYWIIFDRIISLGLIGGLFVFVGLVWQWDNSRVNNSRLALEKNTRIIEYHDKIRSNLDKIMEYYKKMNDTYKDPIATEIAKREANRIGKYLIPILIKNTTHIEDILSNMENRQPRDLELSGFLTPAAPTSLRIIVSN